MHIGFYAPLKPPDHPVPSGDRQMARLLIAAMRAAGHSVDVYARLRSFASAPEVEGLGTLMAAAQVETERLQAAWAASGGRPPDLLFTYHPYYKAPDLIGPKLATRFGLPYGTAEASLSERRNDGPWAARQTAVADAVRRAALNVCFTDRDRAGLAGVAQPDSLVLIPPFIDAAPFRPSVPRPPAVPVRLVAVAMMRAGDKLDSYRFLAAALASLEALPWTLTVIGDGPARDEVLAALAALPADRIAIVGAVPSEEVPRRLAAADVLVWPGFNEAFGLCYLEAQAAGCAVVAVDNAGVPSVVRDGETGLLTTSDIGAYAAAIARLVDDEALRARLGAAAAAFVHEDRSFAGAARMLDAALRRAVAGPAR